MTLLLTACVNPNGMTYTVLQDIGERRKQYVDALSYYLENTSFPVVFCENTLCDFSALFQSYIDSGRLEYLTFDGNNYDRIKGKGYGEALIMIYAIEHSRLIRKDGYVTKITGRIKVQNITGLCSSRYPFNRFVRCSFSHIPDFAETVVITFPATVFLDLLQRHKEEISEYPKDTFLEFVLYRAMQSDRSCFVLPYTRIPYLEGISGTWGIPYTMKSKALFLSDNLYRWQVILASQGRTISARLILGIYYSIIAYRKLTHLL